jgi:hypothetical protein
VRMHFLTFLLGLLMWPVNSEARPVHDYPPEEMENMADLVCNGIVVSVDDTGLRREVSYPGVSPSDFVVRMKARVRVLHTFKGHAPTEFEFTYDVLDPMKYPQWPGNAPEHVSLQKGGRYRFFLKPGGKENLYLGVLDGKIDDGFAVQLLWPNEADDASYLKKDEAVQIARDYLAAKRPGVQFTGNIMAYCQGSTWSVILSESPDSSSNYAAITVRGDCTVDPDLTRLQNY